MTWEGPVVKGMCSYGAAVVPASTHVINLTVYVLFGKYSAPLTHVSFSFAAASFISYHEINAFYP